MATRKDAVGLFWEDIVEAKVSKAKAKEKRPPPDRFWERPDYLPNYAEATTYQGQFFTDQELMQAQAEGHELVYDIESYPNYWLIAFKSKQNGKIVYFELARPEDSINIPKLKWIVENFLCVSFNGKKYDEPILTVALSGAGTDQLHWATEQLIIHEVRPSDLLRHFNLEALSPFNHIDLIEVAPLRASLKTYGGRLHVPRMQDLPFKPGTILSPEQKIITRWYCFNDLLQTEMLLDDLRTQIELRVSLSVEYKQDLRSKSDAQIAEAVLAAEIAKINGTRCRRPNIEPGTEYKYKIPKFMRFETPLMQEVLRIAGHSDFTVAENGSIDLPETLRSLQIAIGGSVYTMGIGGLHSTEKSVTHVAGGRRKLKDRDVVSYYPSIILNQRLYPSHLGEAFLRVYRQLVARRLKCKSEANALEDAWAGQTMPPAVAHRVKDLKIQSDTLKIVINGSFGKLGSMWSILYSPDLLIQVTLSGQLCLLMLIERLELAGISVVSANTDGVVSSFDESQQGIFDAIIRQWEKDTGFETEETEYSGLYSRDVNNYIAITTKGKVKTKGVFGLGDKSALSKNPTGNICSEAVIEFLTNKTPLWKTIGDCLDIRKFAFVRGVTGGGVKVWDSTFNPDATPREVLEAVMNDGFHEIGTNSWTKPGWFEQGRKDMTLAEAYKHCSKPARTEYLGKTVRWYYATGVEGYIMYGKSGNKVPKSDGAMPLMVYGEEFPTDVDYRWYLLEAEKMLTQIGYN